MGTTDCTNLYALFRTRYKQAAPAESYIPFTRLSWLYECTKRARRALVELICDFLALSFNNHHYQASSTLA